MFSKSCKYAIRAVLHLAAHGNEDHKLGVKEISEALQVPKHFLGKILQELSRQGLVSSSKGPTGGFYLSDQNLDTPLVRVIESIDGPEVFHSCILGLPVCSADNPCPLHYKAINFRNGLLSMVQDKTIADVAQESLDKNLTL
jgi:Rrf2 family transcriptional regulator, iron-sulfur cluster assembly transcription factor